MNRNYMVIAVFIISTVLLYFMLNKGLKNKVDPLWLEMNKLANTKTVMLSDKEDELQVLFDSIHPHSNTDAFELVSQPYMLTITWTNFNILISKILKEKKIVVNGVGGTGKSTLLDRISLIITGSKERIIKIDCIEGLEEDYHKRWIGYYDNKGFHPGELLKLFETCKQNSSENYVLIIDDFDKMYRTTFFGEAIWKELGRAEAVNRILGYDKEVSIPENLYIISTASMGINKVPLTPSDYRRLSNGNVYHLAPSVYQLKDYLLSKSEQPLSQKDRDTLGIKLYLFSKANQVITAKIGAEAMVGQWSKVRKLLRDGDFKATEKFILSNVENYEGAEKFTQKDLSNINYSINNHGALSGTNPLTKFFAKIVDFGIFSELTVAILFAIFSFIGLRRASYRQKKTLNRIRKRIEETEKKYFSNEVDYKNTYGQLLILEEEIHDKAKEGKLDFSQANYLIHQIETTTQTMDFISELGAENKELVNFVKKIIADDDITTEEYNSHLAFLYEHKNTIGKATYRAIKQKLTRLHHKSNLKFGRTTV